MNRHRAQGISLLELLIVAAIIVTLAGIVFAAFGPARDNGRRTVCTTNLRQVGLALAAYRHDCDGREPSAGIRMNQAQLGLPTSMVGSTWWSQYIADSRILKCPSYHGLQPIDNMFSTYIWIVLSLCDEVPPSACFDNIVRDRALDAPLVCCDQHNGSMTNVDQQLQPAWETKRVLVLRLSGAVDVRTVPTRSYPSEW